MTTALTPGDAGINRALAERDAALALLGAGDPEAAGRRARAALAILEASGGAAAEVASVLTVLGEVLATLSDLTGARELVSRAARLLVLAPLSEDPDQFRLWCQIQTRLGGLERDAGDLTAAERRLFDVLAVAEAEFGERDDTVVAALNGLGIVYKYAARFDDADAAYNRALTLVEAAAEPDPLVLADLCHNLGGLDHARGRPAPGIAWAERGLVLREAALGGEHPTVAADVAALGALHHLAGRLDAAAAAYRRALEIFTARYGPDHYEVAMTCANLAVLAGDEDRHDEAVRLNERARTILERVLGPAHPDVALTLHNLGVALHHAGRATEAVQTLTQAHAVLAAALPEDHPQLAVTRAALAACTR